MNTHEDYSRETVAPRSSDRSFGLWMAAVLLVAGVWPLRHGHAVRLWAVVVGVCLATIALGRPQLLKYLNIVWGRFGLLLGRIMQPVVMTVLFVVVFIPIGLILRLFRQDPMRVFRDPSRDSYWQLRTPPGPPPETLVNQF